MGEGEESRKDTMAIRVREFDMERDLAAVEELERRCQVGLSGDQADDAHDDGGAKKCRRRKKKRGMSLYVEQIGDPFARVRHSPDYVMLVCATITLAPAAIDTCPATRHCFDSDVVQQNYVLRKHTHQG